MASEEEIRGLRVSLDENKARLYEIINWSYNITFNWKVDEKDCSITVNVSSDGKVNCSNPSVGLTYEDLKKN
ncbi:MAG: hypothetical protein PV345_00330 [Wolbachia sp.]|nr:hypothetical protein [Wolbachia sp.]